jgi:hypothetical protein
MTAARFTVLSVKVGLEQGGQLREVELGAAFDQVTTQDAARNVGRELGAAIGENLCRRLQHGEVLA